MAQDNVAMVRELYEAFAEGDLDRAFMGLAPEIEADLSRRLIDPGIFRGHEGLSDLSLGAPRRLGRSRNHVPEQGAGP